MPIQAPQWSDILCCCICCTEFNAQAVVPVSLGCGHTLCRDCLLKLQTTRCPFDQSLITISPEKLPENSAILKILGVTLVGTDRDLRIRQCFDNKSDFSFCARTLSLLDSYSVYLKKTISEKGASIWSASLSKPLQRKLVVLLCTQLAEFDGRTKAMKAARSLGERCLTELLLVHQNPHHLTSNLWAAVRARGCQFLGPAMQEEVLKLVLLALSEGASISRKVLVMYIVQSLEKDYPQSSKTSVGHVVQLLYRASCFNVIKRDGESSLMQLKEEFRTYEALRREHDCQIVQIALEAGLRISPDQWSSLLYGDQSKKSHMQSIIDKLQTPQTFAQSIQDLLICVQRTGDPYRMTALKEEFEFLASIDCFQEGAAPPTWESLIRALEAVKKILAVHVKFMESNQKQPSKAQSYASNYRGGNIDGRGAVGDPTSGAVGGVPHAPYNFKTTMCRDVESGQTCPRRDCTFAHSAEELQLYRNNARANRRGTATRTGPLPYAAQPGLAADGTGKFDRNAQMSRPSFQRRFMHPCQVAGASKFFPQRKFSADDSTRPHLSVDLTQQQYYQQGPQAAKSSQLPLMQRSPPWFSTSDDSSLMQQPPLQPVPTPLNRPPPNYFPVAAPSSPALINLPPGFVDYGNRRQVAGMSPMVPYIMAQPLAGQSCFPPSPQAFYGYDNQGSGQRQKMYYYTVAPPPPRAPSARVVRSDVLHLELPLQQVIRNSAPITVSYGQEMASFYPACPPPFNMGLSTHSSVAESDRIIQQESMFSMDRTVPIFHHGSNVARTNRSSNSNAYDGRIRQPVLDPQNPERFDSIHPSLRYLFECGSDVSKRGQISTLQKRRDEIMQRLTEIEDERLSTTSGHTDIAEPEKVLERVSLSVASSVLTEDLTGDRVGEAFYVTGMDGSHVFAMRSHSMPSRSILSSALSSPSPPLLHSDPVSAIRLASDVKALSLGGAAIRSSLALAAAVSTPTTSTLLRQNNNIETPLEVPLNIVSASAMRSSFKQHQDNTEEDTWWPTPSESVKRSTATMACQESGVPLHGSSFEPNPLQSMAWCNSLTTMSGGGETGSNMVTCISTSTQSNPQVKDSVTTPLPTAVVLPYNGLRSSVEDTEHIYREQFDGQNQNEEELLRRQMEIVEWSLRQLQSED